MKIISIKNIKSFNSIFDGGIDKLNDPNNTISFINETCVIKYNNLHIHSKSLEKFLYDNPEENILMISISNDFVNI